MNHLPVVCPVEASVRRSKFSSVSSMMVASVGRESRSISTRRDTILGYQDRMEIFIWGDVGCPCKPCSFDFQ